MQVLVTGASGFIGAWITRALIAKGHRVRSLDIRSAHPIADRILGPVAGEVEWQTGDVADAATVMTAAESCDLIVHLAAVLTPDCQKNPIRGAHINLIGSLNVFEAARAHAIARVLYMSSAGVFGPDHAANPEPTTLYGAFKLAVEGAARAYSADHGIASAGLRPLIVYGPERETGLTAAPSLACRAAARGENALIPFSGDTDFVYVTDVADAFATLCGAPLEGAHVYNITGETISAEQFARRIEAAVAGVKIDVAGPSLPVAAGMDGTALRRDYPQIPLTGISDGIRRTVEFYRQSN